MRHIVRLYDLPVLVGASLGGFAALDAAAADPRSISALVLVDVTPDPDPGRVRAFLSRAIDQHPGLALIARPSLVADMLGQADEFRSKLLALELPILLVRGAASPGFRRDDVDRFLELAPHAEIAVVSDAGHLVARDNPAGLLAALRAFLARDDVRRRQAGS